MLHIYMIHVTVFPYSLFRTYLPFYLSVIIINTPFSVFQGVGGSYSRSRKMIKEIKELEDLSSKMGHIHIHSPFQVNKISVFSQVQYSFIIKFTSLSHGQSGHYILVVNFVAWSSPAIKYY